MQITIEKAIPTTLEPTQRALDVAAMFGIDIDQHQTLQLIAPTTITLEPGQLVFITGPSGSGKSTILTLIAQQARDQHHAHVIRLDQLPHLPQRPLLDCFDQPLPTVLQWLSLAGLNDAAIMLRSPDQLSDGQRYRLRLAQAFALAQQAPTPALIVADEFAALLDRPTASVIARNVRKWTRRCQATFIAATTHDDLLEPLEPDLLIEKPLSSTLHVTARRDVQPGDAQT